MVIANGFITPTLPEALMEVKHRCDGHEVRTTPLPSADTMTYWLSTRGDVFGCQRMKDMCVTKPIRVESKYKKGSNIRYSTGGGKQSNAFMQNLMYSTFVTGLWEADMEFTFKDGNPYNYQLTNIEPKKPEVSPVLIGNMEAMQEVYVSHFLSIAWYIRKFHDIPLDDCKDIASDTFFYLCSFRTYSPDYFIGIWKQTADHRANDWWKKHVRQCEGLYWEDSGEERYGRADKEVETADVWGCVRGEKRREYLRLWSEGETNVDIAERMGVSASAVRSEVSRAVKELQNIYQKDISL